jgi:hypothetical protein
MTRTEATQIADLHLIVGELVGNTKALHARMDETEAKTAEPTSPPAKPAE